MDTNKMRDISREQFEQWHSKKHGWLPRHYDYYWNEDHYDNEEFQLEWDSWQASREAVVVRLPARPYASEDDQEQMTEYEIGIGHGGYEQWDKIRDAIDSQGLKVAP